MKVNVTKDDVCLKVGVLGAGTISQAGHLPNSIKARNIELTAICDVSDELLELMKETYLPKKTYTNYEDMLEDEEIDAIIIGIGDQFHVPCALQALEKGKHVLVEKPLGVSVEEINELKELAAKKNLVVQVGNMKRFDPGLEYVHDFIKNEIGDIITFKGWYCDSTDRYTLCDNVMPPLYSSSTMKKPAGNPKEDKTKYYLLGHASHLFDTARYLMGPIKSVEAKLNEKQGMYSWLIACEFESGAIGHLDLTIAIRAPWDEGVTIYGTNGTAYANIYNPWELKSAEVKCFNETTRTMSAPYDLDGNTFRRQLEGFADVILHNKEQKGANIEDGLAAVQALVATYQSVEQGGQKIVLKDVKGGL